MMCGSDTKEFEIFLSGHKPLPTPATFQDGELLGEWRITAFLGKGGSGEVCRAEHVRDSRAVALKVHVRRPGKSDSQENLARERFEREARILAGHSYSFFPKLYEFGEARGYLYFALELLEPISLPNTDADIASFLLELCRAVRVLHGNGLVHRDIKPQNIMRRANGQLVLIDLGLVKESASFTDHSGTSVTIVDGKVVGVGTPRYAAPEQFNGGAVSPATDIHALGMLANECFGGRPPRAWERIISRSTSSIPERRYADVNAFARAIHRRHVGRILLYGVVFLTTALIAGLVMFRGSGRPPPRTVAVSATGAEGCPPPRTVAVSATGAVGCRPQVPFWRDIATDVQTNIVERQLLYEKYSTNDFGVVMMTERAWRNVTNAVAGTVLRLNNQEFKLEEPILLDTNRYYWVVGPGTLDASIEGLPGSRLFLDNCVLINRTKKTFRQCGVRYTFRKGSYLNFISQTQNENEGYRSYIEDYDGDYNALEFQGPETLAEIIRRRAAGGCSCPP